MIIYKATNLKNGKVYIGQTKHSLEYRMRQHERQALSATMKKGYFHEALAKYGFEAFKWEKIDEADTQKVLDELEIRYITEYRSTEKEFGYNLKKGGKEGGLYNEECKRRLGESTKKKWQNPDVAARMKEGLRKGVETAKEKAKYFWEERECPFCGKTFKVKPHWKKKYCSKECESKGGREARLKNGLLGNKVYAELYEEERKTRCFKLFEWVRENIDTIKDAKFNNLTFIKEINDYVGVHDDRTSAKLVGCSYRRDFIRFLQTLIPYIDKEGKPECKECGKQTVNNNGYCICPSCGYSERNNDLVSNCG